ncbi:MAG: class I SAM-dependent methyltransferase [Pyrinomonadaceae bacterium]
MISTDKTPNFYEDSMRVLTDGKTEKVAEIISRIHPQPIKNLLVVGCGNGTEAVILAQQLKADVTGIDLKDEFRDETKELANLRIGDAMNLEFDDASFDFVFSYHALEHIEDPNKALLEISRVLKKGGGFWIGTPNRSRVMGYIGSKETTFAEKIRWNIVDWRARLSGRFRNEFGAHAGFTSAELFELLSSVFSVVEEVTPTYFSTIYENHRLVLRVINFSPLSGFIYPSVYFCGKK